MATSTKEKCLTTKETAQASLCMLILAGIEGSLKMMLNRDMELRSSTISQLIKATSFMAFVMKRGFMSTMKRIFTKACGKWVSCMAREPSRPINRSTAEILLTS